MPKKLSAGEVLAYERDGVFFPIRVLAPAQAAEVRAAAAPLTAPGGRAEPIRQPHLRWRWAFDLATHPAVVDAVEDVLGPDVLVHSTIVFYKRGHSPGYVSWHQDGLYPTLRAPRLTSAWIALTPSRADNGCLRVIPGSHTGGILDHVETPAADNLLSHGQAVIGVDESRALDVVLEPGEMSLHHADIVHGSNPNRAGDERFGFVVRFVTPEVERVRQPAIRVRGTAACDHLTILEGPPAELA